MRSTKIPSFVAALALTASGFPIFLHEHRTGTLASTIHPTIFFLARSANDSISTPHNTPHQIPDSHPSPPQDPHNPSLSPQVQPNSDDARLNEEYPGDSRCRERPIRPPLWASILIIIFAGVFAPFLYFAGLYMSAKLLYPITDGYGDGRKWWGYFLEGNCLICVEVRDRVKKLRRKTRNRRRIENLGMGPIEMGGLGSLGRGR